MAAESLDAFVLGKLDEMTRANLRRTLIETERTGAVEVMRGGRRLISFCCNDYLNLSQHPAVIAAAVRATEEYGAGAGASRLVTGNHPLYAKLESQLAAVKGTEAAIVFGSGYLANTGIIPVIAGAQDLVLADELSHACILAGARLTGGAEHHFRHNDMLHLRELLEAHRAEHNHALILTDGVFSMDGDRAPIADIARLAANYDAWLMTDDAHGIGVLGNGRGSGFASGEQPPIDLQMGTLSKAVGVYGGYLCASAPVIDFVRNRCRTLIYSTGLPPSSVAAAIAALEIITGDAALTAKPLAKALAFTNALGLKDAESAIVPVILGDAEAALKAAALLEDEGYLVIAIRPPTVAAGTARLRVTFTAAHADADVLRLADIIKTRILAP